MLWILVLVLLTVFTTAKRGHPIVALSYQAEENHNVTVEWRFSSHTDISVPSLKIHCLLTRELKVFYNLDPSVKEPQHQQFAGRVRCDTDALSAGLVRLHLSRVRTEDSGLYLCRMATEFGKKVSEFLLNVTAACEKRQPVRPEPEQAGRHRIVLYAGLVLAAAAVLLMVLCNLPKTQKAHYTIT